MPLNVIRSIVDLWDKETVDSGNFWKNRMGDTNSETFVTFCEFCKNLTDDQIARGYLRYLNSDEQWLTGRKFVKFCLRGGPHESNWQAYKFFKKEKRLENITGKEKSKKAHQAFMKTIRNKLI